MISPFGLRKRYSVIIAFPQTCPPVARSSVPRGFGQLIFNLPTGPPARRPNDKSDDCKPQHLENNQLHFISRCGMHTMLASLILLVLAWVSRPSIRLRALPGLPSWRVGASLPDEAADGASRRRQARLVMTTLLAALLVGSAACSAPWVNPSRGVTGEAQEWRGQIVSFDRNQGYMVVRSPELLLDHVFQITRETEVTAESRVSPSLERGQWVTVQYRKDTSDPGPPVAVRVVVIR